MMSIVTTRLIIIALCLLGLDFALSHRGHNHHHKNGAVHDPSLPEPLHTVELMHQPPRREMRLRRALRDERQRQLDAKLQGTELTPLYQGYGTHFSYVYVGTPPQRQSVIIDTGSHWTAFPCTGCSQCGKHTDNYFDPQSSSTAQAVNCGSSPCIIRQSYAEGSSWQAVQMRDKLWVGGLTADLVRTGANYTVDFTFGCQTSETGLFRTQLADGIMGMSMSDDTLPSQLFSQKVVSARMFALCFRVGGGIMTLGGVNQRIHTKKADDKVTGGHSATRMPGGLTYARLRNPPGSVWYTVRLLDVMLQPQGGSGEPTSVGADVNQLNTGKGAIVDSGTTDTYLPASLKSKFTSLFQRLSGVVYTEADVHLSVEQLGSMPDIVFVLEDMLGDPFQVVMPWTNYVDAVGKGVYAFRVYLSEGSGAVLGANFMTQYNVIFDRDNNRIGFAHSSCVFEDFADLQGVTDDELAVMNKTITGGHSGNNSIDESNSSDGCESEFIPTALCTARCDLSHKPPQYVASGYQKGIDSCRKSKTGLEVSLPNRDCHELCDNGVIAAGRGPNCIVSKWSDCFSNCSQWRVSYTTSPAFARRRLLSAASHPHNSTSSSSRGNRHLGSAGTCGAPIIESRQCSIGACPVGKGDGGGGKGDYLVLIDMRVGLPAVLWSYAYANTFEETFAEMFMVPVGTVGIFSNAGGHDFASSIKLRFEIRLKASHYGNDVKKLTAVAEGIPEAVRLHDFPEKFLHSLVTVSQRTDGLDFNRYGWLRPADVEVYTSMSIPLGGGAGIGVEQTMPGSGFGDHSTNGHSGPPIVILHKHYTVLEVVLVAVVVVVVVFLLCVLYFHIQLRREHNDLFMEKMRYMAHGGSKAAAGGRRLVGRMWNGAKLAATQLGTGLGSGMGTGRYAGSSWSERAVGGGYDYDDLPVDENEEDDAGVEAGNSSLLRKKGRPKRKTASVEMGMRKMSGGSGSSSSVVGNSLQSLSSLVTATINPRHMDRDPSHAYRNYDANYRYGKLGAPAEAEAEADAWAAAGVRTGAGMASSGRPNGVVCAVDEEEEEELEPEDEHQNL